MGYELLGNKLGLMGLTSICTTFIPHASVLDAIFRHGGGRLHRAATTSQDVSINETYKWAAIATAAQFTLKTGDHGDTTIPASRA